MVARELQEAFVDYEVARQRLVGPIVPLNIPYRPDDEIDYDNLREYVHWLVEQRLPIIMLTYGSSEYDYLTDDEIYEVTRVVGEVVAGRATFLAAANTWPQREIIRYVEFARQAGAHAVSIQPNWRTAFSVDDAFAFHQGVANATGFPLLSYTLGTPGMPVDLVRRFAEELPGVIGFKNDGDQFYGYFNYLRAAKGRLTVISGGQMRNIFFGHQFGSTAYLCPFGPFAPWVSLAFFDCLSRGDLSAAREYPLAYEAPLLDVALGVRGGWLPFIKSVLTLQGRFRTNRMRLPGPTHTDSELAQIRGALTCLKLEDHGIQRSDCP